MFSFLSVFLSVSVTPLLVLQTSAQQALTGTINSSMQAVQAAQATLDQDLDTLPPLGQDAVSTGWEGDPWS